MCEERRKESQQRKKKYLQELCFFIFKAKPVHCTYTCYVSSKCVKHSDNHIIMRTHWCMCDVALSL